MDMPSPLTLTKSRARLSRQVALHESSAGHSDIGSTFPLSLEIAEKVKTFGGSDAHSTFVLEVLLDKCSTLQELSSVMLTLHQYVVGCVRSAFNAREAMIMEALGGIERGPIIDGFLRKMWQQYHTTFLPTDDVSQLIQAFPSCIASSDVPDSHALAVWQDLCGCAMPPVLEPMLQELLRLYVFTTVCDPPMLFDASTVGTEIAFNPEHATPLDDKIKPGQPCVIICPALYAIDGLVKAKAKVLAADYL